MKPAARMPPQLRPCPWCQRFPERLWHVAGHSIGCTFAKCRVQPRTPNLPKLASAVAAWNTRHPACAALSPTAALTFATDPEIPPGTIEFRTDGETVGKIENISFDEDIV